MSLLIDEAISAISAQQPEQRTPVWMVGEQLKDICRNDVGAAELILADLRNNPQMTLANAEVKISARARANRVGNCGCVSPGEAEEILREFFGLGSTPGGDEAPAGTPKIISIADFM